MEQTHLSNTFETHSIVEQKENNIDKIQRRNKDLEEIHQNLQDIKEMQQDLGYNLLEQKDELNKISRTISDTNANIEEINDNLEDAFQYSKTPIIAAFSGFLIGGLLGGPIGSAAGLKIGGAVGLGAGTAVVGGGVGYFSQ